MFGKQKRIVNKELIETYQSMKCAACRAWQNVSAHHIKSRGSGGHDIPENLIPLCIRCHIEIHQIGNRKFIEIYPHTKKYLT